MQAVTVRWVPFELEVASSMVVVVAAVAVAEDWEASSGIVVVVGDYFLVAVFVLEDGTLVVVVAAAAAFVVSALHLRTWMKASGVCSRVVVAAVLPDLVVVVAVALLLALILRRLVGHLGWTWRFDCPSGEGVEVRHLVAAVDFAGPALATLVEEPSADMDAE